MHKDASCDTFPCMRTTLDINDELLKAAKAHAARHGQSFKALVESALREVLHRPRSGDAAPPIPTFDGKGLQSGVDLTDNAVLEDLMRADS